MTIYDSSVALAIKLIDKFKNPQTVNHQRNTLTPDGAGGNDSSWNDVATGIEAAVIPMSGDEVQEAQRLNYEATHNVYMTYANGQNIRTDDRLIFGTRVFAVVDPRNIAEANAVFKIRVKEGVGS